MTLKSMIGVRFERLLVVGRLPNKPDGTAVWECRCDCGSTRAVAGTALRAVRHKSCGCASPRFTTERTKKHGLSGSRTYRIWLGMRTRCSDSATGKSRRLYYDAGIRVCRRWESFECFLADMGVAPAGMSIDRLHGTRGYTKSNCRWATPKQQANNTSANSLVTHNGQTLTVSMWADKLGIKANTLVYRLRRGLQLDRALLSVIGNARTQRAQSRRRNCLVCGSPFIPRTTQLRNGGGKYCSQACNGMSRRASAQDGRG